MYVVGGRDVGDATLNVADYDVAVAAAAGVAAG